MITKFFNRELIFFNMSKEKFLHKIFITCLIFITYSGELYADDWLDLVQKYTSADKINFAPDRWEALINNSSGVENINVLAQWWSTFQDETLTYLIERAFNENKDMQSSRAKLQEARAQLGITMIDKAPGVNGGASYTNARGSRNEGYGSSNTYQLGVDASWEIDFWGKKNDNINASKADYEAEYASLHSAWVSLSAEVATNYINLRTYQAQLEVANNNIRVQQDVLNLLQSQYDAGLKDGLALQQAKYTLETTRARVPAILQATEETMNALAILTGDVPGSLNAVLKQRNSFPNADVKRLNGIPAETIRQRPDILAAEKNLTAQIYRKKAAEKAYYPTISLTGSIGLESLSSGEFFEGDSVVTSFILPKITWPIFNTGSIRKNIRVQNAKEEQLLAAYEKIVLVAVSEVRNALTANVQEEIKNRALKTALDSARMALDISWDKYNQGLTDFNNVLDALVSVFSIENDFATSNGQRMINLISLFKALGGGWQPMLENETLAKN